jgi:hypothetical protein
MVFQRPCGTLATSLLPRGAHPLNGAMSVLGPGLVDEDQTRSVDTILILRPLASSPRHVRMIAFASHHAFFLKLSFSAWTNSHTER